MKYQHSASFKPRPKTRSEDYLSNIKISFEWYEFTIALVFFGIAAWFMFQAENLSGDLTTSIGSGTFPQAISLSLGITSISLIVLSIKKICTNHNTKSVTINRPLAIGFGIFLFLIFPIAMSKFGYYTTMAIWLVPFAWVANIRKPLTIASVVIGFLLFSKLVFDMLLGTPLS